MGVVLAGVLRREGDEVKERGMYSEESHGDGGGGEERTVTVTVTVTVMKMLRWLWAEAMMRLSGSAGEVLM